MAWKNSARIKAPKRTKRALWVGFKPYGVGETKPNHYAAMARVAWDNRRHLPYAWKILRKGVCDGCALGVAGFSDWTLDGVHLCTTRLELLKVNTADALDPTLLGDVAKLRKLDGRALRELGRLPYPMVRSKGDKGFTRISWDEALTLAGGKIRAVAPDRVAFYLTARGITNEVYYVAQKVSRFLGTNNIDNAARVCHSPSTAALKRTIGIAATTCSYTDVIGSDLIVLFGANVANAQPVFMKYLYLARKRGAKVVVVNPLREPGLERYWVPSNVESAMFGTKMADEFIPVHVGGDAAFLNGVLKVMLAEGTIDRKFVREHTVGFDALLMELERESFDSLVTASGVTYDDMVKFARIYGAAESAVLVWSMGITQHQTALDNVAAIVNLALARGNVGRPGAGLMPIRGHSGVQGGSEMGAYSSTFPGGIPVDAASASALSEQYGFPVPGRPGLMAQEMIEAAHQGSIDVLWSSGGNFLDVLPDPDAVAHSLERVSVRVHQDIIVSSQMLVDPGEMVILLPAATRYEQRDGGTETTTERRIAFSPQIADQPIGEARSEWEIFVDLARHTYPERAHLVEFTSGQQIRDEIARVVPAYGGIEDLRTTGDAVQWGGTRLCEGGEFPMPDGRARFTAVVPRERDVPEGRFLLTTRRGKQFNTMVQASRDPLTGAKRDALFVAADDAARLGLRDGDAVVARSEHGEMPARLHVSPIRSGNVEAFFPEANVLLPAGRREPTSGVPDYNTVVEIVPRG
jgi:molybdopterin-dependent oxidoreductase alpha subunit